MKLLASVVCPCNCKPILETLQYDQTATPHCKVMPGKQISQSPHYRNHACTDLRHCKIALLWQMLANVLAAGLDDIQPARLSFIC